MIEAPKRIWIDPHGGKWSHVDGGTQDQEYVRADIFHSALEEAKMHHAQAFGAGVDYGADTPDPRVLALVEALRAADGHLARGHDKMAHNITRAALAAWEA